MLVFSGYLIPVKDWQDGSFDLKIPNYEIKTLFKKIVLEWLRREVKIRDHTLRSMALSLVNNQISEFKNTSNNSWAILSVTLTSTPNRSASTKLMYWGY